MKPATLAAVLAVISYGSSAAGAERRIWRVEPQGITFEQTASDLRAWSGDPSGAPVFSISALLAAEKKKFDEHAQELAQALAGPDPPRYGEATYDQAVTFEVLSIVGPLMTYRESGEGYEPGTAHPTRYEVLHVLDLARPRAKPSLLDYFSETQMVAALKADPWIRKFANPERGFRRAATLQELVDALDPEWAQEKAEPGDCAFDVSFGRGGLVEQFYFHHLARDRVAVRIEVAPGSEWCNRVQGTQEVGLLLPIPARLREALLKAQSGQAGFLAANRAAGGAPTYSESLEVDVRTLVKR